MFDDKFFMELPDDPNEAGFMICERVIEYHESDDNHHDGYMQAVGLLEAFYEAHNVPMDWPDLSAKRKRETEQFITLVKNERSKFQTELNVASIKTYKRHFKAMLKNSFAYEFSSGDLDRIQVLVNELRNLINDQSELENGHKQRLLNRLEKLQSELHKRVSDLDRFWGLVGDAGVVLGKLGKDSKPIIDRIKEITKIIWNTQSRTEELPSGSKPPLLSEDENT
ncbi:MAG: hypothetical protein JAZ17_01875 [Candidatus Thiodiazotropha endolucinida]|nr:hypothetical protein [Candidatus Thiodiazotropha endolucinida]